MRGARPDVLVGESPDSSARRREAEPAGSESDGQDRPRRGRIEPARYTPHRPSSCAPLGFDPTPHTDRRPTRSTSTGQAPRAPKATTRHDDPWPPGASKEEKLIQETFNPLTPILPVGRSPVRTRPLKTGFQPDGAHGAQFADESRSHLPGGAGTMAITLRVPTRRAIRR